MEEHLQVLTTAGSKEEAERIARSLLEKRLAGCVQVAGPISSAYWWKGAIETAEEWLCLIKTRRALFAEVEEAIKTAHSYETPEIVALPIVAGSRPYLDWLADTLAPQ